MVKAPKIEELTYEQAFDELERIVTSLETSQQSLEEIMGMFERGQALTRHCANLLDKAELKIRQLTGEDDAANT